MTSHQEQFDSSFNKIFLAVEGKLSLVASLNATETSEWWNAEIAPHFREIRKLIEESSSSATKIREEVGYKEDGKDEIYCNFWRCLRCDESSNPEGSNYCLKCGGKFKITLLPSEGESNPTHHE